MHSWLIGVSAAHWSDRAAVRAHARTHTQVDLINRRFNFCRSKLDTMRSELQVSHSALGTRARARLERREAGRCWSFPIAFPLGLQTAADRCRRPAFRCGKGEYAAVKVLSEAVCEARAAGRRQGWHLSSLLATMMLSCLTWSRPLPRALCKAFCARGVGRNA